MNRTYTLFNADPGGTPLNHSGRSPIAKHHARYSETIDRAAQALLENVPDGEYFIVWQDDKEVLGLWRYRKTTDNVKLEALR